MKASVCICTYNGASRVGLVIEALLAQTEPFDHWEVLVIDNASTDGTAGQASRWFQEKLNGRGRLVREDRPGLSFARARAAREAIGQIIVFLDDDNVPAPNFVANVIQAFAEFPRAGVIGGKFLPCWEVKPTALAEAVAPFALAICDLGNSPQNIDVSRGAGIVGAGLCVRRNLLREVFSSPVLAATVTDRLGSNLTSGGDLAISVVAGQKGWECWYVPNLEIKHILPAARMEKEYLLRLYAGIGSGQAATRKLFDWKARSPLAWLIGCKDYGRWLLGRWCGPSDALLREHTALAEEMHELHQRMTLGRAIQALTWPR